MTISSWLNFGHPTPLGMWFVVGWNFCLRLTAATVDSGVYVGGRGCGGAKFLAPPAHSVCVSLSTFFLQFITDNSVYSTKWVRPGNVVCVSGIVVVMAINLFCVFSIKDSKLSALQSVAHLSVCWLGLLFLSFFWCLINFLCCLILSTNID